jgi:hypothetical protein
MFDGNMSDLIGSAHMSQGNLTSFTLDRFGNVNSALALNGGYTQVPAGFYFSTPQFSVAVWVYPSSVGAWARIFDFANTGPNKCIQLSLTSYAVNSPTFVIYDQTTNIIGFGESSIPLEQNKWNFVTVTFNGSKLSLFINGTLVNSTQVSLSKISNVQRTSNFFGKSNWPGDGVSSSYLDEIRFYNVSLTQPQIIELMNENGQINSFSACSSSTKTSITSSTLSTDTTTHSTSTSTKTESNFVQTLHIHYFFFKAACSTINYDSSHPFTTNFMSTERPINDKTLNFGKIISNRSKSDLVEILFVLSNTTHDLNECLTNCSSRGKCMLLNKDQNRYGCVCDEDFYAGVSCQIDLRPCSQSGQCLDNGTCINTYLNNTCRGRASKEFKFECQCGGPIFMGNIVS